MSNWKKKYLKVYFCIVLSDCKVKREIPFKNENNDVNISNCKSIYLLVVCNTKIKFCICTNQ